MKYALILSMMFAVCVATMSLAHAQEAKVFDFEDATNGKSPDGWQVKAGSEFSATVTADNPHSGKQCLEVVAAGANHSNSNMPSGSIGQKLNPEKFLGKRLRLKAAIKADFEDEDGKAIMWLREDLKSGETGAFDNMMDRPIKTSDDWQQHEIVIDVAKNSKSIAFGFLLFGNGKVLVDEVTIEAVDKEVEVTASENKAGISSTPGIFEIVGSMDVKANGRQLQRKGVDQATLLIPLPLRHQSQYPVTFNLSAKPAEALGGFKVFEIKPGNFIAEVTLKDFIKHESVAMEFSSVVLVLPSDFSNVPESASLPESFEDNVKPWLESTWCVNSKNRRITRIAKEIRSETDDVLQIIAKVEQKSKRIFAEANGHVENLIADEALDKKGSCTSCGNLVAALLRASGVPARVLAGYPSWSGPLQTHYIVEAYVPDYGWYPIESTLCRSPWPNQNQVNVSIIPPEYESKRLAGYRTGIAGGVPYLSLTEIRNGGGMFYTVGTIPGHPSCDHACKQLAEYEASGPEWKSTSKWAESRWNSWLDSNPAINNGTVQFGPKASEVVADAPTKLVALLEKSKE